jgi:excisionase family DNA binding protein
MARDDDTGEEGRRLLTVDQLANRWQVSPRTIRRMIKSEKIKVKRIGRAIRIESEIADRGPD